jgi:hypothetical protein
MSRGILCNACSLHDLHRQRMRASIGRTTLPVEILPAAHFCDRMSCMRSSKFRVTTLRRNHRCRWVSHAWSLSSCLGSPRARSSHSAEEGLPDLSKYVRHQLLGRHPRRQRAAHAAPDGPRWRGGSFAAGAGRRVRVPDAGAPGAQRPWLAVSALIGWSINPSDVFVDLDAELATVVVDGVVFRARNQQVVMLRACAECAITRFESVPLMSRADLGYALSAWQPCCRTCQPEDPAGSA